MEKMLRDKKTIAFFVLPAIIVFAITIPIPLVMAIGISFTKWDLLSELKFIGLSNYKRMFTTDSVFQQSIWNTFIYLVYSILMQLPLAYLLAILLYKNRPMDKLFKNTYFVPVVLSGSAVSMMFYFVYHNEIGILNNFIRLFDPDFEWAWLAEKDTAMIAVCFKVAWQYVGYHMIIFISGITSISTDVLEAAKIDGANWLQTVRYVITPLMKPIIKVSLTLITTSSLKSFDSVYVMTGGGPLHATEVMSSWMYAQAFHGMKYGYGSAIGVFLFVLCILSTVLFSKLLKTNYEL